MCWKQVSLFKRSYCFAQSDLIDPGLIATSKAAQPSILFTRTGALPLGTWGISFLWGKFLVRILSYSSVTKHNKLTPLIPSSWHNKTQTNTSSLILFQSSVTTFRKPKVSGISFPKVDTRIKNLKFEKNLSNLFFGCCKNAELQNHFAGKMRWVGSWLLFRFISLRNVFATCFIFLPLIYGREDPRWKRKEFQLRRKVAPNQVLSPLPQRSSSVGRVSYKGSRVGAAPLKRRGFEPRPRHNVVGKS